MCLTISCSKVKLQWTLTVFLWKELESALEVMQVGIGDFTLQLPCCLHHLQNTSLVCEVQAYRNPRGASYRLCKLFTHVNTQVWLFEKQEWILLQCNTAASYASRFPCESLKWRTADKCCTFSSWHAVCTMAKPSTSRKSCTTTRMTFESSCKGVHSIKQAAAGWYYQACSCCRSSESFNAVWGQTDDVPSARWTPHWCCQEHRPWGPQVAWSWGWTHHPDWWSWWSKPADPTHTDYMQQPHFPVSFIAQGSGLHLCTSNTSNNLTFRFLSLCMLPCLPCAPTLHHIYNLMTVHPVLEFREGATLDWGGMLAVARATFWQAGATGRQQAMPGVPKQDWLHRRCSFSFSDSSIHRYNRLFNKLL